MMRLHSDEMGWMLANGDYDGRNMSLMWQTRKIYDEKTTIIATKYSKKRALAYGFSYVERSVKAGLEKAFELKGRDATVTVVYKHNHMYPIYT